MADELILANRIATVPPTSSADSNAGYGVLSQWVVSNQGIHFCVDASPGAAVWIEVPDAANTPKLNVVNTFTDDQIISKATAFAGLLVQSGNNAAGVDLLPGTGTVDARRFSFLVDQGSLFIGGVNDAGTAQVGKIIEVNHAGGMSVGEPSGGTPATAGVVNLVGLQLNASDPAQIMFDINPVASHLGDIIRITSSGGSPGDILDLKPGGNLVIGGTYNGVAVSVSSVQFDSSTTAGETRMLLWDVDKGSLQRVTVGAADSGGSGFKVLRVPN